MTKKPATATKPAATAKKSAKTMVPPDTTGTYLTTVQAAYYLKLSRQVFEGARYRADGSGPPFIKLERAVLRALDRLVQVESHADSLDDLTGFSSMAIEETRQAAEVLLDIMNTMDADHLKRLKRICG